jgi:hypothetical protein
MDFEAKAREVCQALPAWTPPEAAALVADALRAAALDDDARWEARADLQAVLAEVKARALNPPRVEDTAGWHSEPQSTPLADFEAVAQAARAHGATFDGRTHEQAFLESLAAYQSVRPSAPPHGRQATFSPSALAGLLRRLLWLLGLSEGERRFVTALAEDVTDGDCVTLEVFADWLEEEGRTADGPRLRRLVPRDGDVLVFTVATGPDAAAESRACEKAAGRLADILAARGVRCTPVVAYHGTDISALPQQTMRAAGWVRAEDAERAVAAAIRASLPDDSDLGAADPETMRAAGWVRAEDAERAVAAAIRASLPDDSDLGAADPEAMRAAGWVRAEDVRSAADRVGADCEGHPHPRFREGAGNALARVLAALGDAP